MEFHANEDIIELAKSINRTCDSRTKPLDVIIEQLKTKLNDAYKMQSKKTQLIKQLQAKADCHDELVGACKAWMKVESEMRINHPCPDYTLRAVYRKQAIKLTQQALAKAKNI